MSVIPTPRDRLPWAETPSQALLVLAYSTGAAGLAAEAVVHVQEYVTLIHVVHWIGPLFLANAAACAVIVVGLAFRATRQVSALAGATVSVFALGGLILSYGPGLFGWHEAGFRTSIAVAVIAAVVATIALTLALAITAFRAGQR
jgi:hypothetical protein